MMFKKGILFLLAGAFAVPVFASSFDNLLNRVAPAPYVRPVLPVPQSSSSAPSAFQSSPSSSGRNLRSNNFNFLPPRALDSSVSVPSGAGNVTVNRSHKCAIGFYSDTCAISSEKKDSSKIINSKPFYICSGSGSSLYCR